jgi:hypothetical protein
MSDRYPKETELAYEFVVQGVWDTQDLYAWISQQKKELVRGVWETATNIERARWEMKEVTK